MNSFTSFVVLPLLLIAATAASLCTATRPDFSDELKKHSKGNQDNQGQGGGNGGGSGYGGGIFGPGSGFGIPGFGNGNGNGIIGGGYGAGYGGPKGGYSGGGTITATVVCKERGPCYMKKLRCPKKCFTSYSRSGKGYGGGGGGGGCTVDCKKKCVAYC